VIEAAQPQAHDEDDRQACGAREIDGVEALGERHLEAADALDHEEVSGLLEVVERGPEEVEAEPAPLARGRDVRRHRLAQQHRGHRGGPRGTEAGRFQQGDGVAVVRALGAGGDGLHRHGTRAGGAQRVHERAGGERLAHAGVGAGHEDAAPHRASRGRKSITWRPSASLRGATFHACP
jgi:hypothetical protein